MKMMKEFKLKMMKKLQQVVEDDLNVEEFEIVMTMEQAEIFDGLYQKVQLEIIELSSGEHIQQDETFQVSIVNEALKKRLKDEALKKRLKDLKNCCDCCKPDLDQLSR